MRISSFDHRCGRLGILTFLVSAAVLVAACGSDDGSSSSATKTATSAQSSKAALTAAQKPEPGFTTGTPAARRVAFSELGGEKEVRIAFFTFFSANAFIQATVDAAKEVAGKRNASVEVFDGGFDPSKQQTQIQDATASGRFDAFIVSPVDGNALVPVVKQAIAKDIKVVETGVFPIGKDFNTKSPQVPGIVGRATSTVATNGKAIAELTVKACEGVDPCKVALIFGSTSPSEEYQYKLQKEIFKKNPNIKIVARQPGKFLPDPARSATQNILQSNPDLDVITASADQMASGALQAVKAAGKSDKIKVTGYGAATPFLEKMEAGRAFGTTPAFPYDDGLYSADMAIRAVRGQPIANNGVDTTVASGLPLLMTPANKTEWESFNGQFSG